MAHSDRFLLAAVMGWPVMHSRSPLLHNYWFAHYQIAGTYVVPVKLLREGALSSAVASADADRVAETFA